MDMLKTILMIVSFAAMTSLSVSVLCNERVFPCGVVPVVLAAKKRGTYVPALAHHLGST
jgi:hypothetical protein